ncbi:MAG: histidinol-phosphatase HisJ family protein [Oscillospiraceae bacterium]|nr:histidinol-phosphatase HisJ family protein [Oscillospiraceae bacterium]
MRYDMHVHSNISGDCAETMADVCRAAIDKGLAGICFTDHCDMISGTAPGEAAETCFTDWERSYREITAVRAEFGDRIEILHGIELGELVQDAARAEQFAVRAPNLDFLLGSVHAIPGHPDFYFLDYPDLAFCRKMTELYIDENIRMAELNLADVAAHIGYLSRYISHAGMWVDLMDYEERLRHLFGILVRNGRGIEVNTSGLRRNPGPNFTMPVLPIVKLFRDCGGEIVTIGSDAHFAKHVGSHLAEAEELLRTAGFRYVTVFRQRKPAFIKL